MYPVKAVKAEELFSLMDEIFDQDGHAWIPITGMSMFPFLYEGRDAVDLYRTSFETVKRGDIVLIRRKTGAYVLHRVLRKNDRHFFIIGDAQQWIEGPLEPYQLKAIAKKIKRKGKTIDCDNFLYRMIVWMWLRLRPLRHIIMKAGALFFHACRRIFKRKQA